MVCHEIEGAGHPVVLLHAGICDSAMWNPQWEPLTMRHRALRLDFRGFGETPLAPGPLCHAEDVIAVLAAAGIPRAALVGASFGGRVAMEIAVARPDLVSALVLACPGMLGHEWSETVDSYSAEEETAFERGDLDAAVEANLRMWVDGPHRRPDEVDGAIRDAVGRMQRRAFEHWLALPEDVRDEVEETALVPDLPVRLGEISAPTLVILGALDVDDMHLIARRICDEVQDARLATIDGTAHLPNLERPTEFNGLVLDFLATR